ncbi:thiamine phosphate synthase [Rheinheimera aquimaris]|uniref:Thiamine-phosphate synthase n=1 Tax=Rheinheimera aquimaris TaxID=412437 RepID=A0ABN1DJ02_9GAMM|nr:thiamine phosphate synthase [Rheinheimera aquimaris]MCB5211860.1 thiamine phosphate synthase [Rheinheimera aquimaris]
MPDPSPTKPIVWTIASSDSGGGAGIQADLHTFSALECHGCSVITAVTAQNSCQVIGYEAVSPALLCAQLNCLLEDMPPQAIKIGLIPEPELLQLLADWLRQHKAAYQFTVIADPVLSSSSGYDFISQSSLSIWRRQLMPLLDLITPNLPELALLSGLPQASEQQQADQLLAAGAKSVLIKGGHSDIRQFVCDTLRTAARPDIILSHNRLPTQNNHGTGCVLSSAIAASAAHNYTLIDSVIIARAYLQQALSLSYTTGKGAGCLQHNSWPENPLYFPHLSEPLQARQEAQAFAAMVSPIGLYPVVDSVQWLLSLLPCQPDVIQLRLKQGDAKDIEQQIKQAINLSRDYGLRLFINDHWELAIKHGAYGVHLGQEDLLQADLAAIASAGLRLGISTHSYTELLIARQLKPSYIALGHVFATQTKQMPSKPQGLTKLKRYAALCRDIPTVAIGGIGLQQIKDVAACGVDGIAVVSAITAQHKPQQAYNDLLQQWSSYHAYNS